MNEILIRNHIKRVMKYGIPKLMAKEIVQTAYEVSNGTNIEMYADYAIKLTYGTGYLKKAQNS